MITFTEHARRRLKERRIGEDEVRQVLTEPEWKFYDLRNGHQIAIGPRRKEEHYLITFYDQEEEIIKVVTVIDVSKSLEKIIKRRLEGKRWVEL
ncbi:DUF4258 domain-containing protein [Pyrococcus horikoshii]|uniref:DUF4258 domain-containing protein n=1 Tax=Pyrococcus horikoshii TaxID=53953 RepID=A0A832WJ79_PYRHR|nr:DUF4258 domain-containing protein [Pyrococcus horikoshii]HII61012.1 DUF4258 domain-containing protein [Pyrococcus horikoshii]